MTHPEFRPRRLPQDLMERASLWHDLKGKEVLIWSGEHNAYWRPRSSGYTANRSEAGIYSFEEAWHATSQCGHKKQIAYVVCQRQETVASISDEALVRRAVQYARPLHGDAAKPRWVTIMNTFALGSTYAQQLCHRFGIDPEEKIK